MDKTTRPAAERHCDEKRRFIQPSARMGLLGSCGPTALARALFGLFPRRVPLPAFLPSERLGRDPSGAPIPIIDDITTVPPPNLYVAFLVERMENIVVSGGGVPAAWVYWQGNSAVATDEKPGPFSFPLPPPGDVFNVPSDHPNVIYHSYTADGCSSATLSFPITLESWVVSVDESGLPTEERIGEVSLSDDDTITRGGFYTFRYVVRAEAARGSVSDFEISGLVYVHCTTEDGF